MKTTNEYLNEVKAARGLTSEYQLAKLLGVTTSSVAQYRSGRSALGIETCIKVGEVLNIDGHAIYAQGQIERAKKPEIRDFWSAVSEKFSTSFEALIPRKTPRRALRLT